MHSRTAPARHRQLFDGAGADALGIAEIDGLDLFNASAPNLAGLDLQAEGDHAEQEQFGFGVAAIDVGCRIGFGVAFLLRLAQCLGVRFPALLHLRENIIAGAIDDAEHRFGLLDGETLAERTDYRNAAADARFEAQLASVTFCRRPNLFSIAGQDGFVGRYHRLAVTESAQNIIAKLRQLRRRLEAQSFDDDIDPRMIEHFLRPAGKQLFAFAKPFFSPRITRVNLTDRKFDVVTDLPLEISEQDILNRLADHPGAEQSNTDFAPGIRCCHWIARGLSAELNICFYQEGTNTRSTIY